jgi:hypothetical protein
METVRGKGPTIDNFAHCANIHLFIIAWFCNYILKFRVCIKAGKAPRKIISRQQEADKATQQRIAILHSNRVRASD